MAAARVFQVALIDRVEKPPDWFGYSTKNEITYTIFDYLIQIARVTPDKFVPGPGWSYGPSHVQAHDVVVYFVYDRSESIVLSEFGVTPSAGAGGGFTYISSAATRLRGLHQRQHARTSPGKLRVPRSDAQRPRGGRRYALARWRRGVSNARTSHPHRGEHPAHERAYVPTEASVPGAHAEVRRPWRVRSGGLDGSFACRHRPVSRLVGHLERTSKSRPRGLIRELYTSASAPAACLSQVAWHRMTAPRSLGARA